MGEALYGVGECYFSQDGGGACIVELHEGQLIAIPLHVGEGHDPIAEERDWRFVRQEV